MYIRHPRFPSAFAVVPLCFLVWMLSQPAHLGSQEASLGGAGVTVRLASKAKSKRILFIVPWLIVGGMDRAFIDMIHALPIPKQDIDVCILQRGGALERLLDSQIRIISLGRARKNRYRSVISYTHWIDQQQWVPTIRAKQRIQWVHTDLIGAGCAKTFPHDKYRKKVDAYICVSDRATKSFQKLYPNEASKAHTIYNIINDNQIKHLCNEPQTEILPNSYGINVVTACRLSEEKALDRAIRVHERLDKEGIHFRWFIIGGGNDENLKAWTELAYKSGLKDTFVFLGTKLNPYPYIKAADLFVLTSYYEGRSIAISEAQILGIPVLATDVGGAREQITQEKNGLIVDNTEEAIYQGIKRLILDAPFRNSLTQEAQKFVYNNATILKQLRHFLSAAPAKKSEKKKIGGTARQ